MTAWWATIATAALLATGAPALAGTPYEREMTCPIGGEKFAFTDTGSYSTFGSRPDGKPYGSWIFPLPLPECPSNGLVLFREFTADETARLSAVLASPHYAALRQETSFYRAHWLSRQLDPAGSELALTLLHRATWQADENPARKRRYQEEFVARGVDFPSDAADLDRLFLRFHFANGLRELGRFDEALAVLDAIETAPPPGRTLPSDLNADEDRQYRGYLAAQILLMREEIARKNTSAEPLRMIPEQEAAAICARALEARQPAVDTYCESPALAQSVEEIRGYLRTEEPR